MKTRTFSVIVPDNPDLLLALATNVWKKHQQDGANSIRHQRLWPYFKSNWTSLAPKTPAARIWID
ncbi:MAG: hypothetical protein IPJ74_14535 [Saprospiraceae bacterium]|nr:hypothetical protein [Saprospiraceae bacterium]